MAVKKATKAEIAQIKALFLEHFKDARTELVFSNDFELLIAVMLSAQCSDKRVNLITPELFAKFPTPQALSKASLDSIKECIKTCSFFNNKFVSYATTRFCSSIFQTRTLNNFQFPTITFT